MNRWRSSKFLVASDGELEVDWIEEPEDVGPFYEVGYVSELENEDLDG